MRQALFHFALALMCVSSFSKITQANETGNKIYAWIDETGTPVFSNISASPRDWTASEPAYRKAPQKLSSSLPSETSQSPETSVKPSPSNKLSAHCRLARKIESRTDTDGKQIFSNIGSNVKNNTDSSFAQPHAQNTSAQAPDSRCNGPMPLPDQDLLAEMNSRNNDKISGELNNNHSSKLDGGPDLIPHPDQHDALQDH